MAGSGSRRGGSGRKAGGSAAENLVAKQLHGHEEGIRLGAKETAVIRTADGQWAVIPGAKNAVKIPLEQWQNLRGGLLTHNHPSAQGHSGRLGKMARQSRAGDLTLPLSPTDIAMAQRHGLREMRAVGSTRKYRYRPGAGDAGIEAVHARLMRSAGARTQRVYDRAKIQWAKRISNASGKRRDRLQAMADRALTGILAGQAYIAQATAFRNLKRMGFDVKAKRGRPLMR